MVERLEVKPPRSLDRVTLVVAQRRRIGDIQETLFAFDVGSLRR